MTDFTQQLDDYVAAHAAGDQRAINAVFASIDDEHVDTFLAQLAQRLPDVAARGITPTPDGLRRAMEADGLAPEVSSDFSLISVGDFDDWVTSRMQARGIGARTLMQDLYDQGTDLDDETLTLAADWLERLTAGDDDQVELPDDAARAIAAVLEATPQTITSMVARRGATR